MPELPEVQTIVNDLLEGGVRGAVITRAEVLWPRTVSGLTPEQFCRGIAGKVAAAVRRRGKFIVFDLVPQGHLLVHLRMSGRLIVASPREARSPYDRLVLRFGADREVRLHDTRKFGRCYLVEDTNGILDRLGPEPLDPDFSVPLLAERLRSRRRRLKPLLLDQSFLAGLGNIYVDEALWEAKLHPCRVSATLTPKEIRALHKAIVKVLEKGIRNSGTSLGRGKANFRSLGEKAGRNQAHLEVFRRTSEPCGRCRCPIERIVVGQRGTHICPQCQAL